MRTTIRIILLATLAYMLTGCGNCVAGTGEAQQEDRLVPEFSAIEADCSMDIIIRDRILSEKNKVVVEAQSNLLPLITTRVSGSTLKIGVEGCMNSTKRVVIYVHANEISKITHSGSGSLESDNALRGDQMELNLKGSGSANLKLQVNRVDVHNMGSGSVVLSGNTNMIEIENDGSGSADAAELKSNDAKVNLTGSGSVSVYANREAELNLSGSGSINYSGKPGKLETSDEGSGEIRAVE